MLTGQGFEAICVAAVREAQAAITAQQFAYAVVNLRLGRGDELKLIEQLRQHNAAMRIVVVTDVDSFASVIVALRAGADDYIPQPVGKDELIDALLDRAPVLPPVPDMPLGLSRTCWEHVMRIYEQCDRNVSHRRNVWACTGARSSASLASARRRREPMRPCANHPSKDLVDRMLAVEGADNRAGNPDR